MTLKQIAERLERIAAMPSEGYVDSHDADEAPVFVDTTNVHEALRELQRDIEAYLLRTTGTL